MTDSPSTQNVKTAANLRGRAPSLTLAANPYLLLALAALCWSGNHVVGRAIAGHAPPLGVSTVRWLIPALVVWLIARPHIVSDWPVIRAHWRIILFLGLTGGALFSAGQYVGLQYTTALNVSVLNSLSPVFIIAAAAVLFHERLHPMRQSASSPRCAECWRSSRAEARRRSPRSTSTGATFSSSSTW